MKILVIIALAFLLPACQTFSGIQADLKDLGQTVSTKAQSLNRSDDNTNTDQSVALDNPLCPSIIVDPQLDTLTEFYDETKTADKYKVSYVHLARASTKCEQGKEYLTLTIDLAFDGSLGPKARRKQGDQPFFAYPYFVSVKDENGQEIVKELFAVSMQYKSDQEQQSVIETIRQQLPYNDNGTLPKYQVHVGLQLTQNQLFYNASL